MLALQPQLIEIITWNGKLGSRIKRPESHTDCHSDYGESHYMGPSEPNHTDDGSSEWAVGFPHDGWRIISKPYIAAYKAGASTPTVTSEQMVYWYRPTPWDITCTGDPLGPPNGRDLLADVVFITTMLTSPAQLTVQSGSNAAVTIDVPAGILTNNFTMGLGSQTFTVARNGVFLMGGTSSKQITDSCVYYNYNAYVGSFNATGGSAPPPPPPTSTPSSSAMPSSTSTSISSPSNPSTTSTSVKLTTLTSTSTTTAPPPSSTSSSTIVCVGGTGSGNYVGLCNFCCEYGYCPPGPCTCTASGAPIPTPPVTGVNGYPLSNEDNSYLGLCSFACNHGYCPSTACQES